VIYHAANILSTDNTNNGVQFHRNTVIYRAANILSTDNTNNGVQSHRNTVIYRAANILSYNISCTVTVRDTDNCQNIEPRYRLYGFSLNLCYCKMEQDSIVDTYKG
jgi:accessory colonization factor AcfC